MHEERLGRARLTVHPLNWPGMQLHVPLLSESNRRCCEVVGCGPRDRHGVGLNIQSNCEAGKCTE